MKIYLNQNVFEAALDRIRRLYDEFPNIVVSSSGGKDSTVILELAIMVAKEKGRLPVKAMFIDQEAEWQATIDYMRYVNARPEVELDWLQIPIKLFNATSPMNPWLYCWEEGKHWMREKEETSQKENIFGTDRFIRMFDHYQKVLFPDTPAITLGGIRTEESPGRYLGIINALTYKDISWGRMNNSKNGHYSMYPIYDWSWKDVWKAIHDNKWKYCRLYDYMYQYGIPIQEMRVSNVHHETAVRSLFIMQEIEKKTWNRLVDRLNGINTAGIMQEDFIGDNLKLPPMFVSWREYRDYLLPRIITDPEAIKKFATRFINMDNAYENGGYPDTMLSPEQIHRAQVRSMLINDFHMTTLKNFEVTNMSKGRTQRNVTRNYLRQPV